MKGIEAVAQILKQEGVEYLFSYPINPLIEAAAALGIRPIVARTEKTLINMTDGYTRATNGRQLGVCCVQAGPGIENAFGGVAQAYADSIPLLLLPGGPDQHRQGGFGEFDPLPSYQHVTKWAARLNFADRGPEMLRRAFTLLRTGRPGPVLLELPGDVSSATVDDAAVAYTAPRRYRSAGDPSDVAEAARLLVVAPRPLLHAGHGVLWAEAWDELRELAELLGAPVMTTMAAKGAFPEDHPLSAGTAATTATRSAAYCLKHSDVVLGIGCSFARGSFSAPIPPGKTLIHSTNDPADVDKHYPADLAIVGDARLVLRQLIQEVQRQAPASGAARAAREAYVAGMQAAAEAGRQEWHPRLVSDETPINPYRVIWELMQAVDPRQTILTHDSGNPRDQLLTTYRALTPRGYLGWGKSTQLGTGLGLAMGAKLAHPDKLCVNVMGDLAFGTAGMEIETAVRERIATLTILLNNSRMGGYTAYMPIAAERYHTNRLSGRYADGAAGLGAYAERVENPGDVAAAIQRGIAATRDGRPAVLEMITKEEPVYPRTRPLLESV